MGDTVAEPEEHAAGGGGAGSHGRLRTGLAVTALVLGCVALLAANLAVFLKAFVFDEDTFVDAVAPRQPDETVIEGLADTLSTRIVDSPAVQRRIEDLTPGDSPLVAGVIANEAGNLVQTVLRQVLASDAFRTVWRTAVTQAHRELVRVVEEGDRRPVVLDLTDTLSDVDQRLERQGIDVLDDRTIDRIGEVVTVRRGQIDEVRVWLDRLQSWTVPLVVLALALLAAAVALAHDRRRMLLWAGAGTALAMVVTALAVRFAKHRLTARIEIDPRRAAVSNLWDRVFAALAHQTTVLLLIGLAIATVAYLAGPSTPARSLRARFRPT